MIKLMLDTHKFNNYAFFCPVSRLHLTVSNPVGYTNEVTAAILRALKAKNIIDVDDVIDLETGTVKNAKNKKVEAEAPIKNNEANKEVAKEAVKETIKEVKAEAKEEAKAETATETTAEVEDKTATSSKGKKKTVKEAE